LTTAPGGRFMSAMAQLAMRSGNPALSAETFRSVPRVLGSDAMTIEGTVNKTGLALVLLMAAAAFTWNQGPAAQGWVAVGFLGGFVAAMVTVFKKEWAPITTPLYAVLEGLGLGGISVVFDRMYPGIVSQAVFLTFGVLGAMLLAYRTGLVQATERFKLGVFAATGGIAIVYLVGFVLSFFGMSIPLIHGSSTVGILFSVAVVVVAALNLVLDFDFIEQGAERGAPRYMEWYGAVGLLVTLVWLYLELLRLLSKLQERR
jgi:uncharacterized YccA/Bax inhibitor family protein